MIPLSQQIKAAADRLELGPTELARRMGRGHSQVSRHMDGTHEPTDETLIQAYANALGVTLTRPSVKARRFTPQKSGDSA